MDLDGWLERRTARLDQSKTNIGSVYLTKSGELVVSMGEVTFQFTSECPIADKELSDMMACLHDVFHSTFEYLGEL